MSIALIDSKKLIALGIPTKKVSIIMDQCRASDDSFQEMRYLIKPDVLCKIFQVEEQTVSALANKGEFPRKVGDRKDRNYDMRTVIAYLWRNWRNSGETDQDKQLNSERIEKLKLENAQTRAELINRHDAEQEQVDLCAALVNMLNYTIKNVSPELAGMDDLRKTESILRNAFKNAFRLLKEGAQKEEINTPDPGDKPKTFQEGVIR